MKTIETKNDDCSSQERTKRNRTDGVTVHDEGTTGESKQARAARRNERKMLTEKIPKVDENGVACTKQQLRRMRKRVAKGLDPIESEQERETRLRHEAEIRREEEAILSGEVEDTHTEEGITNNDDYSREQIDHEPKTDKTIQHTDESESQSANKKRRKRPKLVPDDYICSACQNLHQPVHWIYDCPDKVTMRGSNQVAKKLKGIHNPDSRKVFVSGLPFDVKQTEVVKMFASCGKITNCKIIKFEDSGRCKGQAILSFDTDEAAQSALQMSGTMIENEPSSPHEKGQKQDAASSKRKELKLKVTKALSRIVTRKKTRV